MRRQSTIYARLHRRFSDHQGQSKRRQAQHERSAGSLLHVHRTSTRSRGTERERSSTPRRHSACARLPLSGVRRTATTDETQGFMKVLVGGSDDRILGFTMIGAEAGEVMAAVQTAMLAELPYPRLRDAVLAHPTMAEGLGDLFSNVPARFGQ